MSDEQKQIMLKFAWSNPLRAFGDIRRIDNRLRGCRSPKTQFALQEFYGVRYPIYKGPFGLRQDEWMVVLGGWIMTQAGGGTSFEGTPGKVELKDNKITSQEIDPTTPRPLDDVQTTEQNSGLTLQSHVAKIQNRLNRQASSDPVQLTVDACISSKRVLIIGENEVVPRALLTSIAEIHNLRVLEPTKGTLLLTIQGVRPIRNPNDLKKEVRRMLPISFWRAFDQKSQQAETALNILPSDSPDLTNDPNIQAINKIKISDKAWRVAAKDMYVTSVRNLRTILEPLLERAGDRPVRWKDIPEEAHDLVALSSLITCVSSIRKIPEKMPSYITQFDQAQIALPEIRKSGGTPKSGGFSFHLWCTPQGAKVGEHVAGQISGVDVL
jgi:hypothetical protein